MRSACLFVEGLALQVRRVVAGGHLPDVRVDRDRLVLVQREQADARRHLRDQQQEERQTDSAHQSDDRSACSSPLVKTALHVYRV